jgi:hypothetical protein
VQPLLQWKDISITQSGCVFVAFGIQHAMRLRHRIICDLSGSTIFFHTVSLTARFCKKKVIEHEIIVLIYSTTFEGNIFHSKKKRARYDQNTYWVFIYSTRDSCQILAKLEFYRVICYTLYPTYLTLLELITVMINGEQYKLRRS